MCPVLIKSAESQEYSLFAPALDKWFSAKPEGTLPSLENFVSDKDSLAEYRALVSIEKQEPLSMRYNEVGERLEGLYGKGMSGRSIDHLYNSFFRKRAYEGYGLAITNAHPVYDRCTISTIIKKIGYERLILPFGSERVTGFLTYIVPTNNSIKLREDWDSVVKATPWL